MKLRPPVALAATAALAAAALAVQPPTPAAAGDRAPSGTRAVLEEYMADSWDSMAAMTDESTGLPADNIGGDLDASTRSGYTSPTNIGAYLWSTVAARDTGLISRREARERARTTIETVAGMEKHEPSGMFYNWYDPATGDKLDVFPGGGTIEQFASSVDNGWLATGLLLTERAIPALKHQAAAIRTQMDFGYYYNPAEGVRKEPGSDAPVGGQIRGGFWVDPPSGCSVADNYRGGEDVYYTCHHYGSFNTEPRIASYLGIAAGQIPAKHYFGTLRTFPPTCDWSWTETKPTGEWHTYEGVDVFEGTLPYRGHRLVPTWGGSMFEALMVPLFVPEERWGARSWGVNHPLYVQAQIEHGMDEAGYGYWGFSPSNIPTGGYREYGVDQLGLDGPGYTSDGEDLVGAGLRGVPGPCRHARTDGVRRRGGHPARVVPRASLRPGPGAGQPREPAGGLRRLRPRRLLRRRRRPLGHGLKKYLALDQGMVVAALGNALAGDALRGYVSRGALADKVRPLMEQEVFTSRAR